jgi:photosystem II stability/assembly factor-like uncharacterized protein
LFHKIYNCKILYSTESLTKPNYFMKKLLTYLLVCINLISTYAQNATPSVSKDDLSKYFKPVKWRNIGPFRGGRSVTIAGVLNNNLTYYTGTTGGGLWKTEDAGLTWQNISDGFFKTSSVGAVAVSESDPNIIFVGMGEHAPRGVMTSYGDGVYKSTDAGKTWRKMGLDMTRHISNISIHPLNPDIVYVAAQGALHGPNEDRGIYKSTDGGKTWRKTLYVDAETGCSDLSMDMTNPSILYAAMWEYRRLPWQVKSGGKGSGLYKSTDGGETWNKMENGLPKEMGKMGISVSRANANKVYAVIESDTKKEQGGVFVSNNAGESWTRISKDHNTTQRAWYYIEIFADPMNENTVYVLNTSVLKSIDGGKTWGRVSGSHGDHHGLWINPRNNKNIALANDGGGAVTYNGGQTWSLQSNQPTAQFYRVNADNLFPYNIYGGQQDNTSVMIASRNTSGGGIGEKDWSASAGGESAFLAFNPDNPRYVMGGSYQGTIEVLDMQSKEGKPIMVSPIQYQSLQPKNMKYRFNWNAPIICSPHEPNTFYHGGNKLFKTNDLGKTWQVISPDLTRNDSSKMGISGVPYTNEGAGGENYCTLAYVAEAANEKGVIWTGSDDGLVHLTTNGGATWSNVTPKGLDETLINSIEVSPHDKGTAYIATTRYKFNDFTPSVFKTTDYGKTWTNISKGVPYGAFTRVIREDDTRKGLLYCGTETGLYISYDSGNTWQPFQLNMPLTPITDLKIHKGDLLAATMGRSFWVLDDLSVIRQFNNNKSDFQVYKPEDTYRIYASSPLDKIDDDDDNTIRMGRNGFAGINPASGVVIYYNMPEKKDTSLAFSLEILDEKGNLVRKYTNKYDTKFVSFTGGPSADPILPTRSGLNRFVWDMRYATMAAVPHVFIEGSYDGRKAAPGAYQARFKMNGVEKIVPFKILNDPRLIYPQSDYEAQQKLAAQIEDGVNDMHNAVNAMRKVRKQISDVVDLLGDKTDMTEVVETGKKTMQKINDWEENIVQTRSQSNDDVINFENKLSADYIFLKGELDVNIPYVTKGQQDRFGELNGEWQKHKKTMSDMIQNNIAQFNKLCAQKQIGKVIVPDMAFAE